MRMKMTSCCMFRPNAPSRRVAWWTLSPMDTDCSLLLSIGGFLLPTLGRVGESAASWNP